MEKNIANLATGLLNGNGLKELSGKLGNLDPSTLGDLAKGVLGQGATGAGGTDGKLPPIDLEIFNKIFKYIYAALCISTIFVFVSLTFIALIDVISYIAKESRQYYNMSIDKIFIKDTTDYKLLDYAKSAATISSEPQYIYLEASMFKSIYKIFGITCVLLAVQIIIYLIIWIYSQYGGKPREFKPGDNQSLSIPYTFLMPIIIAYIGALVLDSLYNSQFVNTCIPNLQLFKNNMTTTKTSVYKMMSVDSDFLNTISGTSYDNMILKYANMLNNKQGHTCDINNFPYKDFVSGIVTHSLMTLFSSRIPEVDINYNTIMNFFTYEQIIDKTIDPQLYFYYKHTSNISNIWVSIKDDVQSVLEDPNGLNNKNFFNTYREDAVRETIDQHIRDINLELASLYMLPQLKKSIFIYIVAFLLLSSFILYLIIASLFAKPLIDMMIQKIKNTFDLKDTPAPTPAKQKEPPEEKSAAASPTPAAASTPAAPAAPASTPTPEPETAPAAETPAP